MKILKQELIFSPDGTHTPSNHASTLAVSDNGTVYAAWFGGTKEKDPDVEIYCSFRECGKNWSEPVCVSEKSDIACWNPVLFRSGIGVRLFFKRGEDVPLWKTYTRDIRAENGILSLSEEHELVPGDASDGRGPVKNKPVRLSNGCLLAGASHEYYDGTWLAFADRSDDNGKAWERTAYIEADKGVNLIQPTLWEDASHGVHMLLRSNQGAVYRADSADMGKTWSPAYRTALSNNNSGIDAVRLPDGRIALLCNPVSGNWAKRTPLSLYLSEDNGISWEKKLDLETADGEFSYPAVIYENDRLLCTYTYNRVSVMYCKIDPEV